MVALGMSIGWYFERFGGQDRRILVEFGTKIEPWAGTCPNPVWAACFASFLFVLVVIGSGCVGSIYLVLVLFGY